MTITSTDERPTRLEPAESFPVSAPPTTAGLAPPVHPGWTWVDVEEADPPRRRTDWLTRFAWAKVMGGW